MALSDDERARLAAKYESPAWKPTLPRHPLLTNPRAGVWAATLLTFVWLLLTIRIPLQRCDDIYFFVGAKSMASGQGFSDISRPEKKPQLKYPPLRAVLQLPFLPFLKENIRPLRITGMLCLALMLPLAYGLLAPRAGHRAALWALLLSGLSPMVARLANFEGSFLVVALLWVGVFWLVERVRTSSREVVYGIALGVVLALGFYAHRMALILIPSATLYLFLLKKRRAALIALGVSAALALPWLWRSYALSGHWISPDYEAEIVGRQSVSRSTFSYMLGQIGVFPGEVGYGLFPWWKASGGATWPFLTSLGLGWLGPVSAWLTSGLMLLGWARSLKESGRTFVEWFFPLQTLMLLAFFVGFQYYAVLYPWLFFWLFRGVQTLGAGRVPRTALAAGATLLLACALAKDIKAFLLFPATFTDKDSRWSWVRGVVPPGATVYYLDLENYAFAPLRWFDTERMAVGVTERELSELIARPEKTKSWISLPKSHALTGQLKDLGWKKIAWESFSEPPPDQILELSDAQRNFLRRRESPQALWHRN